jgi:hypothetical protein
MAYVRVVVAVVILAITASLAFAKEAAAPAGSGEKPLIQLAILLDTSSSMDGLIDQARSQLWTVVNELARTKRHGQTPSLQVGLYQYGNDGLNPKENWIQLVLPFTDDLDKVSEKLFALKTNGGEEYCGATIAAALKELDWSKSPDAYRVIFIAGNEPFTQGPVDFHEPCATAKGRDIVINTIHCGPEQAGVASGWRDGAVLANGIFMSIDTNQAVIAIAAPQDQELAKLSGEINSTYIPYGRGGADGYARQAAQDANASTAPAAVAAAAPQLRAMSKASSLYQNSSWDLVDATKDGKVKIDDVKESELPDNLKKMSKEERKKYVQEQTQKRSEIQGKIKDLSKQRDEYIAAKRREQATTQPTLDAAMLTAVRGQITQKQFEGGK